jgi:hypothetical protein
MHAHATDTAAFQERVPTRRCTRSCKRLAKLDRSLSGSSQRCQTCQKDFQPGMHLVHGQCTNLALPGSVVLLLLASNKRDLALSLVPEPQRVWWSADAYRFSRVVHVRATKSQGKRGFVTGLTWPGTVERVLSTWLLRNLVLLPASPNFA